MSVQALLMSVQYADILNMVNRNTVVGIWFGAVD